MNRGLRIVAYVLGGIVLGLLLAVGAIQLLTRTEFGQERVRRYALDWLRDQVRGEVRVGRLAGAGLLSGVTVYDFAIIDTIGRPFVVIDSARLQYDWRTLLGGSIVFDEATLYSAQVAIERLPGDTLWNYERIFPDTTPGESTGPGRLIMLDDVRIVGGVVHVRRPWDRDDPVEPEDTARVLLEDVGEGQVTVWRFEIDEAELPRVLWESPIEDGRLVQIASFRGNGYLWADPMVVNDLTGTLTVVDSVVSFDFPRVELPATRASAVGRVTLGDAGNRYDVRVDGSRLSFADLRWLYPPLPAEGGGSLVLRIQSQDPKGTLFLVENARLTAPGTQMAGTFGVVAGDTLYFTSVDLRASPLDVELIEALVPGGLPVEGLLIGTVEVSGPISALRTEGDVRFARRGSEAPSAVRWAGTLDLRSGVAARSLEAELHGFELDLFSAFRPGMRLHGRVTGTLVASGALPAGVHVQGALEHVDGERASSRFEGGGIVRIADGRPELDLALDANMLPLVELGMWVPALAGLHGTAHGPVRLAGTADDLHFRTELALESGALALEGQLDRTGEEPRMSGVVTARDLHLRTLSDSLPDALLTGTASFELTGRGLGGLSGPLRVALDSAQLAGVPLDRVFLSGALDAGVIRVDTFAAASAGVRLSADGSFGLVDGRAGALRVGLTGDALDSLEPLLFEGVADPTQPRIQGRVRGSGVVTGSVSAFHLSAGAELAGFHYGDERIERARIALNGSNLNAEDPALRLHVTADSLLVLGRRADSATVALIWEEGSGRIFGEARHAGAPILELDAAATRTDHTAIEIRSLALGSGSSAWTLGDTARMSFAGSGADVDDFSLARADGRGRVHAGGRLAWSREAADTARAGRPLDFRVAARGVPFDELLRMLGTGSGNGRGTLDGTVTLTGTETAPVMHADVLVAGLGYDDVAIDRLTATLAYDSSLVAGRVEAYEDDRRVLFGEARIPADLRFVPSTERRLARTLELGVQADSLPAALVLGFFEGFRDTEGLLDGAFAAAGTTRDPELTGALTLRRGATTWSASGVRYRDITGTFLIEHDRVVAIDLSAGAAGASGRDGGSTRITGTIDLEQPADPSFDLTARAHRLLAASRRDMELTTSGTVRIGGRYRAPIVGGELDIDEGSLYLDELYRQYLILGLEDPLLFEVVDTSLVSVKRVLPSPENPFLRNLAVEDATIRVRPGSWLRSREMNVEVTGELTVSFHRPSQDLRLTGTLTAIRGTYRLDYPPFSRTFDVRGGTVDFPGTPGIDPNLAITAVYRARTEERPLDILANLSGTLQGPRVRLTTDDDLAISESDLASYLFFGAPTHALNAGSGSLAGSDGSSQFDWAVNTAINTFGFGYFATGLQTLAQTVGIVDYVGLSAAETMDGAQQQGIGGLLASTEIELGRYLSPELFVAATQRLDSQSRPGVRLEWRFHPQFTTEFFIEDRFARAPIFGLGLATPPKKVYGFSLFREWGY